MIPKTDFMSKKNRFFFYHFRNHHMKILLGDFNAKLGGEDFSN